MDAIHDPLEDEHELEGDVFFDTLAELVNTIGGRFLNELLPQEQSFTLGLPLTGSGDGPKLKDISYEGRYQVSEYLIVATVAGHTFL